MSLSNQARQRQADLRAAGADWRRTARLLLDAAAAGDRFWLGHDTWRSYLATIPISEGHASKLLTIARAGVEATPGISFTQAYELARRHRAA